MINLFNLVNIPSEMHTINEACICRFEYLLLL